MPSDQIVFGCILCGESPDRFDSCRLSLCECFNAEVSESLRRIIAKSCIRMCLNIYKIAWPTDEIESMAVKRKDVFLLNFKYTYIETLKKYSGSGVGISPDGRVSFCESFRPWFPN